MKGEMRVQFQVYGLKEDLQVLADRLDISLNQLVNQILAAELSPVHRKSFDLMKQIADFKHYSEEQFT